MREIKGGSPQGQTVRACEGAQGLATAGAGLRDAATGPRGRTAAERPRAVHAPSGRCPLMGVAAAAAATASPHALSTKVRSNTPWAALKGGTGRGGGGGDEGLARVTHGAGLRGAAGAPRQKPASCGAGKCARTRAPYLDAAGDSEVPEKPQRAEPAGGEEGGGISSYRSSNRPATAATALPHLVTWGQVTTRARHGKVRATPGKDVGKVCGRGGGGIF